MNISQISQDIEYWDTKKVLLKKWWVELLKKDTAKKVSKIVESVWKIFNNLTLENDFIKYDGESRIFTKFNNCKSFYYLYWEQLNWFYSEWQTNLVSWMCLFDTKSMKWTMQNWNTVSFVNPYTNIDNEIVSISIDKKLTVYEAETITRILSLLKNISEDKIKSFAFQIPYIEYMLYLADIYNLWLLNSEFYLDYIKAVEEKKDKIEAIIKKRLSVNLSDKLCVESPLENIKSYIVNQVKTWNKIDLQNLIDILKRDEIFKKIFETQIPNSFKDIVYASYVYLYVKNALNSNLVALENPSEVSILRNVKKVIWSFQLKNSITWIYIQPIMIAKDGNFSYFWSEEGTLSNIKNACSLYINK